MSARQRIDRTGEVHDRLTVLHKSAEHTRTYWVCLCVCGNTTTVRGDHLKEGRVGSCGCIKDEQRFVHGMSYTRTYSSWQAMKSRCTNPNDKYFFNYGARGITVCESWLQSFENFFADMGEMPEGLTLERKDNSLGYSKGNCRWATRAEQVRNRRNNILITHDGRTLCLKDWCSILEVPYCTARLRIKRGIDPLVAIGVA